MNQNSRFNTLNSEVYKIWLLKLECTSITNVTKLHAEFLRFWNAFYFPFFLSVWFSVGHFSLFWSVMYLLRCFPFLWQCQLTPLNLPLLLSKCLDVPFEAFCPLATIFSIRDWPLWEESLLPISPALLVDVCLDERNEQWFRIMKWT